MTCIVGIEYQGKVYMGGDSAAVSDYVTWQGDTRKVFKIGEFLIGYTYSFRMGQIIQHHLNIRPQRENEDTENYLVTEFIESVRACLKEKGFAKVESNTETGGYFLVGYRGRVYTVETTYQINRMRDGFAACGSGMYFALGALAVTEGMPPKQRIKKALKAAARFSYTVRAPFHIEVLKK